MVNPVKRHLASTDEQGSEQPASRSASDRRIRNIANKIRIELICHAEDANEADLIPVLLSPPGLHRGSISLRLPRDLSPDDVVDAFSRHLGSPSSSLRLALNPDTRSCASCATIGSLLPAGASSHPLSLQLIPRLPGGKGGFGSMLRAAGGKMSSKARKDQENTDSCRDLNGRRLSVMKEAKKLAAYLEQEPERRKAMDERMQAKYRRLEKMLGRTPKGREDFEEAARKLGDDEDVMKDAEEFDSDDEEDAEAGPSSAAASRPGGSGAVASSSKGERAERFEDHEYLEQSREIVSNARSAVAAAMMKKKKKAAANKAAASEAQANL